ncbi:MAG: hypothetical protein KGQ41_05695 [Alphaproteobacteria bacterium]|nr:hypothetical protein [Alphaproteobacteria bacterium]
MSAVITASSAFSSEAAGTKRKGTASGKLGGNIVKNIEAAFEAIKALVKELPAKALGLVASACKQAVQVGPKLQSAPFAVPLHMMGPGGGSSSGAPPPKRIKHTSEDEK